MGDEKPVLTAQGRGADVPPGDAPESEAELERGLKAIKDHLQGGRLPRAGREMAKLLATGVDPARIAFEVAAFDAQYHEQGVGQALALVGDALRIAAGGQSGSAVLALLNAADAASDACRFRAARRVPPSQDPGREPDAVPQRLAALCDAADAEGAEGLMRGALWRKWGRDTIEPWFYQLCARHFLGGGQGLVHVVQAFDLLSAVGFEHARRILPGLTYALATMTRDDEYPDWQLFQQRYAILEPRLTELWERMGKRTLEEQERNALVRSMLDGSRNEAWHAAIGALASGIQVESLIDALSRASAERLWRFNPAFDTDALVVEGWLDVARCFTHVHALREAARRHARPTLLRMLLFAVCQVNRTRSLDLPAEHWLVIDAKGQTALDRERASEGLERAIREREPVKAQQAGLAFLAGSGSVGPLQAALEGIVLRDLYARPSTTAQAMQLVGAAAKEAVLLPEAERAWPLRAVIRMLASPVRERAVEAVALDAQSFLSGGPAPRRLT